MLKSSSEPDNLINRDLTQKFDLNTRVVGVAVTRRKIVNLSLRNGENTVESIIKLAENIVDESKNNKNNSILVLEPNSQVNTHGIESQVTFSSSILACPMYSATKNITGVFEALDKSENGLKSKKTAQFSKKEEGMLQLVCVAANYILNQDQGKEKSSIMLGVLRELLRVSTQIMKIQEKADLIRYMEIETLNLFNADSCRIYLVDCSDEQRELVLYRYQEHFNK